MAFDNPCIHCETKEQPIVRVVFGKYQSKCSECGAWSQFADTIPEMEVLWNLGQLTKKEILTYDQYLERCRKNGVKPQEFK